MVKPKTSGYKRFDPAVKERAFQLLDAGQTGKAVAKELGISYPTLINWKRERANSSGAEVPHHSVDSGIELELLRLENDYLKKRMETDDETSRLKLEIEYLRKRLALYE